MSVLFSLLQLSFKSFLLPKKQAHVPEARKGYGPDLYSDYNMEMEIKKSVFGVLVACV